MKPFLCQQQTGLPASRSHAKCRRKLGKSLADTGVGQTGSQGEHHTCYTPPADLKVGSGWTKKFEWQIIDHEGNVLNSAKTPIYPPGRVNAPQFAPRSEDSTPPREATKDKGKQCAVETPTAEVEDPWIETPRGGSTSRDSSKPRQISFAAAAAATKPKITAPQPRYDNIPTARFMGPMPKQQPKRTGNYGKRYMIKFHKDEKPLPGTAITGGRGGVTQQAN